VRVGFGFDVHRFGEEKADHRIMLAGVAVPFEREIIAHSDGDVIIHALCDALLGAAALGDIGTHFADTDEAFRDADSRSLLAASYDMVRASGLVLGNADITLIAERPKVAGHVDAMRDMLASILDTARDQVSIKATTSERMGFIGREEGIAAHAVVLLV
jgi:2-C-methyl-D-erythritol 2,4-cyclodiphosphate synthase